MERCEGIPICDRFGFALKRDQQEYSTPRQFDWWLEEIKARRAES